MTAGYKKPTVYLNPSQMYELEIQRNYEQMSRSRELVPVLVSRYIPLSLLRTTSLYVDPFSKWRIGAFAIADAKRNRQKRTVYVRQQRTWSESLYFQGYTTTWPHNGPYSETSATIAWRRTNLMGPQPWFWDYFVDTTAQQRGVGTPFGEMKRFKVTSISSPGRTSTKRAVNWATAPGYGGRNISYGSEDRSYSMTSSATFSEGNVNSLKGDAWSTITTEINRRGVQVMTGTLPAFRPFTFGRSIIELRDLPRTVLSLRDSMGALGNIYNSLGSARDLVFRLGEGTKRVPKEYLGYHFAWKQMYEDVKKILLSPERIARRFNYLQQRTGKDSVHRYSIKYPLDSLAGPGFSYDPIYECEYDRSFDTIHTREIELRAMSSLYFDFPEVALPILHKRFQADMLGLELRITDIYKVIPWTWLYDWYSSLGSYIDIIETVNRDKTTINYGFVTGVIRGTIRTRYKYSYRSLLYDYAQNAPSFSVHEESITSPLHTSELTYVAAVRIGAHKLGLPHIHQIATRKNLTPWQQSILAALLAARVR